MLGNFQPIIFWEEIFHIWPLLERDFLLLLFLGLSKTMPAVLEHSMNYKIMPLKEKELHRLHRAEM